MECLQNRLESFTKPVRVQNPSKTGASKNIKWPHPDSFLANPMSLAEAGFYYNPSYDDRDSVTCFVCEKELGGWEVDDDPFDIHYSKCAKTCCWAVVRCGLKLDLDSNGRFIFPDKNRLPKSKPIEKARLQTYSIGEGWTHDETRNHGASSKKMAKAGFVFTPQHADDDLATCLYCGTCLSSWDSGDDPLEEHRKRKGDCPFFGTSPPASTATTTTTTTKGRSVSNPARTSRASTAAATRTQTRGRNRSTIQDIVDDTAEPLEPPVKATATRKASRATKKAIVIEEEELEEEEEEEEEEVEEDRQKTRKSNKPRASNKSVPRKASSKAARKTVARVEEEDEEEEEEASQTPPVPVAPEEPPATTAPKSTASRKSSRSRKNAPPPPVEEEEEHESTPDEKQIPLGRSTLGKSTRKKKPPQSKKPPTPLPEEGDEPEEEVALGKSVLSKRSSRSKKAAAPSPVDNGNDSEEQEVLRKSTLSKKPSRSTKAVAPSPVDNGNESEEQEVLGKSTSSKKPSRSTKAVAPPPVDNRNEPEEQEALGKSTLSKKSSRSKRATALSPVDDRDESEQQDILVKSTISKKPSRSKEAVATPPEEDSPPAPKPSKKKTGKPKSTPVAKEDDDVEMEEVPKEADAPKLNPEPIEHAEEVTEPVPQPEPEVETDVDVDIQTDPGPTQQPVIEVDEAMSFAPRLVTKTSSLQPRGRTPELIPIPSFPLLSQLEAEPSIVVDPRSGQSPSLNNLATPVWSTDNEPPAAAAPISPLPHSIINPTIDINGGAQQLLSSQSQQESPEETILEFTPFLSKLPFIPLQSLSEAEQDMTVEEWIRYQIEVEYDKFKRDGERLLLGFRQKAEEVRKVIEGL